MRTPPLTFLLHYWTDVLIHGIEVVHRAERQRVFIAFPTNDGLVAVAVQGSMADFQAAAAE